MEACVTPAKSRSAWTWSAWSWLFSWSTKIRPPRQGRCRPWCRGAPQYNPKFSLLHPITGVPRYVNVRSMQQLGCETSCKQGHLHQDYVRKCYQRTRKSAKIAQLAQLSRAGQTFVAKKCSGQWEQWMICTDVTSSMNEFKNYACVHLKSADMDRESMHKYECQICTHVFLGLVCSSLHQCYPQYWIRPTFVYKTWKFSCLASL